ncbi:MAG TPA: CBS domain-containing protein [Verrucomicrobiae bacterium]|jgi:acetoin utilization protein AcuB|nr:CBS domain-containing protein [Verrucomicrobiae bacterium]
MIVAKHMTERPVVVGPDDFLLTAERKMKDGGFRRLPVVHTGILVGIVTDRDLRRYHDSLDKVRVCLVMAHPVITVVPSDGVEKAARLMLQHKIGGIPVVRDQEVVGIITRGDLLRVFVEILDGSDEGTARIDFLPASDKGALNEAFAAAEQGGAEVLALGTHRERWGGKPICYFRLRSEDPNKLAELLRQKGYAVVGVYE